MSIGMTYEQFWYGDNDMCYFFYEAHKYKAQERNQELYVQGIYNYEALCTALYNAFRKNGQAEKKYRSEPLDIFPKTDVEKEAEAENERQKAYQMFEQMRLDWIKKNGNTSIRTENISADTRSDKVD